MAQNVSTFVKRYITAFTTRISFKDSSTKYLLRWGVDFRQVSSDILAPFSKPAHGWLGRIVNFWQEPHHIGWAKVALVLEEKRWKSCCWCFRSCHRSCFLIFRFVLREHFCKKIVASSFELLLLLILIISEATNFKMHIFFLVQTKVLCSFKASSETYLFLNQTYFKSFGRRLHVLLMCHVNLWRPFLVVLSKNCIFS